MTALPTDALLDLAELDTPPQPPDYLVHGLVERGSVLLLAGDSGTCKSLIAADLAIACVQGRPWLGRAVDPRSSGALYVDLENPRRLALRRLRALGVTSSDSGLRYWSRPPLQLANADDVATLVQDVDRHRPDVLVLDSAITVSGVDPNDNKAVAAFCAKVRRLAEQYDLVAVILHHESKHYVGNGRTTAAAARAALGAMSWRAQADLHLAVELPQQPREARQTTSTGEVLERYRVRLRLPKVRDFGDEDAAEDVVIESTRTEDRALLSMRVRSEAVTDEPAPRLSTEDRMRAALDDGPLSRDDLADVLQLKRNGGGFKGAVAALKNSGRVAEIDGRLSLVES